MAHYGRLGSHRFSEDVDDIRRANVYGSDGEKLGKIDDVIFDHSTMEIRYVMVDSDGWLEAGRFLLPADRIFADAKHKNDFTADATKQQVEGSPTYDEKSLDSENAWKKYVEEFQKYWVESPVMYRKDSDRIITPPEEPSLSQASSKVQAGGGSVAREVSAADLFPERLSDVFSDPKPGGHKVTLRPRAVQRAEEAAPGRHLAKTTLG